MLPKKYIYWKNLILCPHCMRLNYSTQLTSLSVKGEFTSSKQGGGGGKCSERSFYAYKTLYITYLRDREGEHGLLGRGDGNVDEQVFNGQWSAQFLHFVAILILEKSNNRSSFCLGLSRRCSYTCLGLLSTCSYTDPLHIRKNTQKSKFLLSQAFKLKKICFS